MKPDRPTISTRSYVRDLLKSASEKNENVDFSEVNFISRAAADEIIFSCQEFDVHVNNVQSPIDEMMRIIVDTESIEDFTEGKISTASKED